MHALCTHKLRFSPVFSGSTRCERERRFEHNCCSVILSGSTRFVPVSRKHRDAKTDTEEVTSSIPVSRTRRNPLDLQGVSSYLGAFQALTVDSSGRPVALNGARSVGDLAAIDHEAEESSLYELVGDVAVDVASVAVRMVGEE